MNSIIVIFSSLFIHPFEGLSLISFQSTITIRSLIFALAHAVVLIGIVLLFTVLGKE